MASLYGILTLQELEYMTGIDFSSYPDKTGSGYIFSDNAVEFWISASEMAIRAFTGINYDSTNSTDGVKYCVAMLTREYAINELQLHGILESRKREDKFNASEYIRRHLLMFLQKDMAKADFKAVGMSDVIFDKRGYENTSTYGEYE